MIRLTPRGEQHNPKVPHHFSAWGGIKELIRVKGAANREDILEILKYCWHNDPKFQPNTAYLDYAVKRGWLSED